jgi:hypothetical protein
MNGPCRGGQQTKPPASTWCNMLGYGVVMISTNGNRRMFSDPLDTRDRVNGVIDKVAGEQANIEIFFDRLQGRPIGMDVSQDKYLHNGWLTEFSTCEVTTSDGRVGQDKS